MHTRFKSVLSKHQMRHLFQIKRDLKDVRSTMGFVVDFSDSLILFHVLDMDTFRLNGYMVIREEDVSEYRFFAKPEHWQCRAVRHFRLRPARPAGISVASLPELLTSVARHYPLITLHPEKKNPDVCYIGPLVAMTERTFTITDLNCNAEWTGPRRMRFSDVTRIDFGGGYESALAATAPKRRRDTR